MNHENAVTITNEFFKRRFPDKDIAFEKECGYFGEWVTRFRTDNVEGFMDNQSLKIWREMIEEDKKFIINKENIMNEELSACCGANINEDSDVCLKCGEHCEVSE